MDKGKDARKPGWFWADNKIVDCHAADIGIHAFGVYMVLVRHLNSDEECWPSSATIAKTLGISQRTVVSAIKTLAAKKLIEITPREVEGKGQISNLYTVHRIGSPSEQDTDTPMHQMHRGMQDMQGAYAPDASPPMQDVHTNKTKENKTKGTSGGAAADKSLHPEIRDRMTALGVRPSDITHWLRTRPNATLEDVELCEAWVEANGRPNGTLDRPVSLLWKEFLSIGSVPPPIRSIRRNGHTQTNTLAPPPVRDLAVIAENERLARAELEADGIAWE